MLSRQYDQVYFSFHLFPLRSKINYFVADLYSLSISIVFYSWDFVQTGKCIKKEARINRYTPGQNGRNQWRESIQTGRINSHLVWSDCQGSVSDGLDLASKGADQLGNNRLFALPVDASGWDNINTVNREAVLSAELIHKVVDHLQAIDGLILSWR